uniref:Uncharacterized protein n=1 Tax=Plectus sambesii TaxID=2011161 RepID=A0A914W319_9BILA
MNPSSTKLFITTNSSTLGFLSTEVNEGCGTLVNVIVTLAEPFMPPYSSLYMCDYMCLKKTPLLPTGFSRKGLECGIENCNKNSTVYVFSQPLAGSWGCFFPFGGSGQRDSYPSFWTTTILLSLFCLIGFSLNVALIVMSTAFFSHRRAAFKHFEPMLLSA